MVCDWGMSEKLGPMAYGQRHEEIFLGREIANRRDYSEKTAQAIDEEIVALVLSAEQRAESLLRENIDKLHELAGALLEFEVLDESQIERIVLGERLRKPEPQTPLPEPEGGGEDRAEETPADEVAAAREEGGVKEGTEGDDSGHERGASTPPPIEEKPISDD
jgi:cell division protease FtsH